MVGIILAPDISTVYGSSEHFTHNVEGIVDMYGTAGGGNALSRLRVRVNFDDLGRVIGDGSICQWYIGRVERANAGEIVGEEWGTGDRGYSQVDGPNSEARCLYTKGNTNCKVYVKSESTRRIVCSSGGGAHKARFMMIGEFP